MKKCLVSIIFCTISLNLFADASFLPDLRFDYIYRDNEFIDNTSKKGIDLDSYINFLISDENPLGEKAALIVALSNYFENIVFDDNPKNDHENYFEEYSHYFEEYLLEKYEAESINSKKIPINMQFLTTLMDDFGTYSPNIKAYDRFAEIMPQSLTVQSVKVIAYAYDIVYNKSDSEMLLQYIDTYEKRYFNPYKENFENYNKDIVDTELLSDVIYWRRFMGDDYAKKLNRIEPVVDTADMVKIVEPVEIILTETEKNVLTFREKYPEKVSYSYVIGDDYYLSQWRLDEIYKKAEYYLANSKQDAVISAIRSKNKLSYVIQEIRDGVKRDYAIGFYAYDKYKAFNVFLQGIFLNDNLKIYEYYPKIDVWVEFE